MPDQDRRVAVAEVDSLKMFESLLPVETDSVLRVYSRYNRENFYATYQPRIEFARRFIDSVNVSLDPSIRIDTLSIDHSLENFGNAAVVGKTIYLSSCYFFLFSDLAVIRGLITHEFGHLIYRQAPVALRTEVEEVWQHLRESALLYLFREGEYSGNARFGGHPEDNPGELFASAFNLFANVPEELMARLRYVEPRFHTLIRRLETLVRNASALPGMKGI